MATVRLYRNGEEEITGLPCVCMRCGAAATGTRSTRYWDTIWRRQWVAVPLCEMHWYSAYPSRVMRFAYLGMSFIPLLLTLLNILTSQQRLLAIQVWFGIFIFINFVQLVSWFVLPSPIRPKKITKTYIELTGVAPRFVVAVIQEWEVFREHFADARGLRFDAAASADERILPSVNDVYRAKP